MAFQKNGKKIRNINLMVNLQIETKYRKLRDAFRRGKMLKATQIYNIFSDVAARMMFRQSINIFHTIFLQVLTLSQHLLLKIEL